MAFPGRGWVTVAFTVACVALPPLSGCTGTRCGQGETQQGDRCVRPCNTSVDCAGNQQCREGACEPAAGGGLSSGGVGPSLSVSGSAGLPSGTSAASSGAGSTSFPGSGRWDGGSPDGGADAGAPTADVTTFCGVQRLLSARCGACHRPGGIARPDLTAGAVAVVVGLPAHYHPGHTLVVAGSPADSLLFRKLAGTQAEDEGDIMPPGVGGTPSQVATVRAWIEAGAPVVCNPPDAGVPLGTDGGAASGSSSGGGGSSSSTEEPGWMPGPNGLDQQQLFQCAGATPGSSVARLRRMERREWTHAVGKPLVPTSYGSGARNNPLDAPRSAAFSTYSEDVSIDEATLDLYFGVLAEAGSGWQARSGGPLGVRTYAVYNDTSLACMFNDAAPAASCVNNYVRRFLEKGVLFRAATPDEVARLQAFAVSALARESPPGTNRTATLRAVTSAAWLTSAALFKTELGGTDDGTGRFRLTDAELGRALAGVLSTFPPGASATLDFGGGPPAYPNWTAPPEGRLAQLAAAAADGTIQTENIRNGLVDLYVGVVDPMRYDLQLDVDDRRRPLRGEWGLAPRVADFFREWLGYGDVAVVFKDTPRKTSQWDGQFSGNPMYDPFTTAYNNLLSGFYGFESTLVEQLDDTIARVVLEDTDVFRRLLTTRTWHLASNLGQTNGVACASNADCAGQTGYTRCSTLGLCATSVSSGTSETHRPFNLTTNVPATQEGRWVTLPSTERAGVLTHPAWLAAHGGNFEDDASLVHRGKWVRENLLCEDVPPLELVMVEAKLVPSAPDKSARQRVVESIETGPQSTTCMGCHARMNTLGYPFEIYNHAGFVRATDHGGAPNGQSTITNAPDPALNGPVANAVELSEKLASSPHAKRCFLRQAFRYFMGRHETYADACTLNAMEVAYDQQGSFISAVKALTNSDAFLYRRRTP